MFKPSCCGAGMILSAALAAGIALPCGVAAEALTLGGTGTGLGTMRILGESFHSISPETRLEVLPSIGSSGGIKAVLAGAIDIAVSARPLKEEERKQGALEWAYAKTPLVWATHQNNGQSELSRAELIAMYDGTLRTWKDGRIARIVLRSETETDTELLRKYIPGMDAALAQAYQRRGPPIALTDQDAADMIQTIPGALGPSTLALILSENRPLKALRLDSVAPTVESLGNGNYIMSKNLYLITRSRPKESVQRFIDFILSKEGAEILQRTGHLVLTQKPK